MASDTSTRTVSNLIWRFLERFGAQIVTFVVSIVLARLLDPTVYGTVALITVFTAILQVFVDSGLGNALIQKKDADDVDFSTVFYFNVVVCLLLYAVMFFCAPLIARFYDNSNLTPIIRVASFSLVISGVKNVQQAYVSKTMQFKRFFFSTLGGTIGAAIVGIFMAYKGYGVWALVAQNLFNLTVDTVILWVTVKWRPIKAFSWKRLKGLFSFGWKLLASALLDTGYNEARALIIGKKYTSEDLAYYNRGQQFPNLIVSNINTSIDSVLLPTMSEVQDKQREVKAMTRRAIKTSSYIMCPLMMGLAVCAEPLILLLLTEKWLPCVPFLQIFCFVYAFYPIHTSNLNAMKAMGRSDLFLILEILKKSIGIAAILISMWFGVFWIAFSLTITTIISSIINAFPNRKLLSYSWFEQMKDILPNIGLALLMGVPVFFMGYLPLPTIVVLALQVLVGATIYIGASAIFKLEIFTYLRKMIRKFLCKNKKSEKIKMKKLLLLGGSAQQVVAIEKAKQLGYATVLCDFLSDNPGQYVADKFYLVSTTDKEAVLKVAQAENVDGILAYASDPAAPTAAYVAEKMGLPGNPYASVEILCNKDKFREFLKENGFSAPQSNGYASTEDVLVDAPKYTLPIIVKPVDSSGSKGVTVLHEMEGLEEAAKFAFSYSRNHRIIVEEFIEKKHAYLIGGDIFICDGKVVQWGLMNCHRDGSVNPLVPVGKSYPAQLEQADFERVKDTLQAMIDKLGIKNGAMNVELVVDKNDRVFPIDIGPRSGGNMIPDLLSMIFDTDVVEMSVKVAMGVPLSQAEIEGNAYYATHNLHSAITGKFCEVHYSQEITPHIVKECIYKQKGDRVEYFDNAAKAIGIVFLRFDSQEQMQTILRDIQEHITVSVERENA